jgi:hypothetical protein
MPWISSMKSTRASVGGEAMKGHLNVSPIGAWHGISFVKAAKMLSIKDSRSTAVQDPISEMLFRTRVLPIPFILLQAGLVYCYVKKISGEGSEAEDQDRHAPLDI